MFKRTPVAPITTRGVALFILTAACALRVVAQPANDSALLTVAEKSDFRATARYSEVVALCEQLAKSSPLVKLTSLGTSGEGRDLPLLLIADPPVATPEQAVQFTKSGEKLLVFAIGNIHAGEVDGKEALPILAREILAASKPGAPHPLLKDLILAFAPIYNADGNERVSTTNRPGQIGPEEGMGQRESAAGLDLNRDFIKLEAGETRGLVDFLNRWDPAVFIDCHTTNGCFHRYIITYEGPKNPAGDATLLRFCRDEMMPAITRDCEAEYNVPCFVYGDFNPEHTKWETYPAHARYGTTYVGLRNRISILSEGYSYATYKQRVLGTRDFVKSCLEYAAANKARIHKLLNDADAAQSDPQSSCERTISVQTKAVAAPRKVAARGFVEVERDGKFVATDQARDYDVELWTHFVPTLTVPRPQAYLVPAGMTRIIDKLREHGIAVEPFSGESEAPVEIYRVDKVAFAEAPFQKHKTVKVEVTPRRESRQVPVGTFAVRTNQKLGSLVAILLEPQSEDGLLTWNFFDEDVKPGADFPVWRLSRPAKQP